MVGVSDDSFFCQKEGITMVSKQQRNKRGSAWFVYVILGVIALIGISMGLFFSSHPSWVGEQPGNADYVHRTLGPLSDLPHMTA